MDAIVLKSGIIFAAITLFTGCGGESLETPGMHPSTEIVNSSDGVPITYEAHGSGTRALVFVHGWSLRLTRNDAMAGPALKAPGYSSPSSWTTLRQAKVKRPFSGITRVFHPTL
jgi:hypothetical protein